MKKTIKTPSSMGFKAASKGDQAFADMHPIQVIDAHDEKVSKALDDIAQAKSVIPYDRVTNKHGYKKGEDEAAYDSFKYNAGGPVVAPVYTKSMHEQTEGTLRSCIICLGKSCSHCNHTGYMIENYEHSNSVVRSLRRANLQEGKKTKAVMHGIGRALQSLPAVGTSTVGGLSTGLIGGGMTGSPKMAVAGGIAGAAAGAAYIARQGYKGYKAKKQQLATMGEDTIHEASNMRLVKTFTEGPHSAKVYKDREWNEYRVQFHKDGKHLKKADSHHDDKADAFGTAQHQLKRMNEGLDEGLAALHNAAQDRIRSAVAAAPGKAKSLAKTAMSNLKNKVVSKFNDLEDRYQGGPQRRAMQAQVKKKAQAQRIAGKAAEHETKASRLTKFAGRHLASATTTRDMANKTNIPNHNMHAITTTDDYERKKGEIETAKKRKAELSAHADQSKSIGLAAYDKADHHAARAARIKDRLDNALAGRGIKFGAKAKQKTEFQSRLKEDE